MYEVLCSALNATLLNFVGLFAIEIFGASVVHLIGNVKVRFWLIFSQYFTIFIILPPFWSTFFIIWRNIFQVSFFCNVKILLTIWAASLAFHEPISNQQYFGTILSGTIYFQKVNKLCIYYYLFANTISIFLLVCFVSWWVSSLSDAPKQIICGQEENVIELASSFNYFNSYIRNP